MLSKVTNRAINGAAAIAYCEEEHGHNGHDDRNLSVCYYNMMSGSVMPVTEQMRLLWNRKSNPNHKVQVNSIVISASRKEFDPENPEDVNKFECLCYDVVAKMEELYGCPLQAAIYIQCDGKGGMLHAHVLINDCRLDNCRSVNHNVYYQPAIRKIVDELALNYIPAIDNGEFAVENPYEYSVNDAEGKYKFKRDIKRRILIAMHESTDEATFLEKLDENGISIRHREGGGVTYILTDTALALENGVDIAKHNLAYADNDKATKPDDCILINDKGKYQFKEDIKRRILLAKAESSDEATFRERLKANGLLVSDRAGGKTYQFDEDTVKYVEKHYGAKVTMHGFKLRDKNLRKEFVYSEIVNEFNKPEKPVNDVNAIMIMDSKLSVDFQYANVIEFVKAKSIQIVVEEPVKVVEEPVKVVEEPVKESVKEPAPEKLVMPGVHKPAVSKPIQPTLPLDKYAEAKKIPIAQPSILNFGSIQAYNEFKQQDAKPIVPVEVAVPNYSDMSDYLSGRTTDYMPREIEYSNSSDYDELRARVEASFAETTAMLAEAGINNAPESDFNKVDPNNYTLDPIKNAVSESEITPDTPEISMGRHVVDEEEDEEFVIEPLYTPDNNDYTEPSSDYSTYDDSNEGEDEEYSEEYSDNVDYTDYNEGDNTEFNDDSEGAYHYDEVDNADTADNTSEPDNMDNTDDVKPDNTIEPDNMDNTDDVKPDNTIEPDNTDNVTDNSKKNDRDIGDDW